MIGNRPKSVMKSSLKITITKQEITTPMMVQIEKPKLDRIKVFKDLSSLYNSWSWTSIG